MPSQPPPPVVAASRGPGERQVYVLLPAGYRLSQGGLDELNRVLQGAHVLGDGQTLDWHATAAGGFVWAAEADADLVRMALKDIALEFMEPAPVEIHRRQGRHHPVEKVSRTVEQAPAGDVDVAGSLATTV